MTIACLYSIRDTLGVCNAWACDVERTKCAAQIVCIGVHVWRVRKGDKVRLDF